MEDRSVEYVIERINIEIRRAYEQTGLTTAENRERDQYVKGLTKAKEIMRDHTGWMPEALRGNTR